MSRRTAGIVSAVCLCGLCFPHSPAVAAPTPARAAARLLDTATTAHQPSAPTFELYRSVNIETWFRLNQDISTWGGYLSDAAMGQLAALGFGTVRLAVSPQYFMA